MVKVISDIELSKQKVKHSQSGLKHRCINCSRPRLHALRARDLTTWQFLLSVSGQLTNKVGLYLWRKNEIPDPIILSDPARARRGSHADFFHNSLKLPKPHKTYSWVFYKHLDLFSKPIHGCSTIYKYLDLFSDSPKMVKYWRKVHVQNVPQQYLAYFCTKVG